MADVTVTTHPHPYQQGVTVAVGGKRGDEEEHAHGAFVTRLPAPNSSDE